MLEMLRILVSLPIIFAAEFFVAFAECTAVGSMMTFQMLFQITRPGIGLCAGLLRAAIWQKGVG